jgi:hypothetical protein
MEAAHPPPTEPATAGSEGRPEGPVAAALLATGVGSLVLAVLVVIAEAKESFAMSLAYSDRVGPLSGKTIWAVIAYLGSWAILTVALRGRRTNLRAAAVAAGVLLALALVGTFSPFFELFKPD